MDDFVCGNPDHDHDPEDLRHKADEILAELHGIYRFVFNDVDQDGDITLIDAELDNDHAWSVQQHHNAMLEISDTAIRVMTVSTTRVMWLLGPSKDALLHGTKATDPDYTQSWWCLAGIRTGLDEWVMALDEEGARYLSRALEEGVDRAKQLLAEGS